MPGNWAVEHHDDYDGYLLIMISPNESSTHPRASFLISGKADEIDVAELHDEELRHLGCFSTIQAATAEVAKTIDQHAHLLVSAKSAPRS